MKFFAGASIKGGLVTRTTQKFEQNTWRGTRFLLSKYSTCRHASSLRAGFFVATDGFFNTADDLIRAGRTITTNGCSDSKTGTATIGFVGRTRNRRAVIPFVIQRGGTSKGIFFRKEDLPECPKLRDLVIKDAFGSPDIRQIDGLGGADVLTSKVAIVSRRRNTFGTDYRNYNHKNIGTGADDIVADVDYLFGQVEFSSTSNTCRNNNPRETINNHDKSDISSAPTRILYDVNCGNISAGVGPYAIDEGLIEVSDDTVTPIQASTGDNSRQRYFQKVRIHNVNTGKVIIAEVPVEKIDGNLNEDNGLATDAYWTVVEDGDYAIDGVPGTSSYLPLDFSNCIGTLDRIQGCVGSDVSKRNRGLLSLLPTGNTRDTVVVDKHQYDVSLLDVANFVVHIDGRQLGLIGEERSTDILKDEELWNKVRKIRYEAAKLVMKKSEITLTKPFTSVIFPFLRDHGYESINGDIICDEDQRQPSCRSNVSIDFRSFAFFCDHPHKAYPGTASNATAAAALIDGTVVNDIMNKRIEISVGESNERYRETDVSIGHPSGRLSVSCKVEFNSKAGERSTSDRKTSVDDNIATSEICLRRSVIGRTSRRIADGFVYLKAHTLRQLNN